MPAAACSTVVRCQAEGRSSHKTGDKSGLWFDHAMHPRCAVQALLYMCFSATGITLFSFTALNEKLE